MRKLVAALAVALMAAGCGGDDDGAERSSAEGTAATASTEATTTAPASTDPPATVPPSPSMRYNNVVSGGEHPFELALEVQVAPDWCPTEQTGATTWTVTLTDCLSVAYELTDAPFPVPAEEVFEAMPAWALAYPCATEGGCVDDPGCDIRSWCAEVFAFDYDGAYDAHDGPTEFADDDTWAAGPFLDPGLGQRDSTLTFTGYETFPDTYLVMFDVIRSEAPTYLSEAGKVPLTADTPLQAPPNYNFARVACQAFNEASSDPLAEDLDCM